MKTIKYILILLILFGVVSACNKDDENPFTYLPQIWDLTFNYDQPGNSQTVEVMVTPFTNSGTFGETDDSQGLWVYDAAGAICYRLPVGGNIVHDSPGDRWSFVGMSGSSTSCGMQTLGGNTSGMADDKFPCAIFIEGEVTLTHQFSNGTTMTFQVKWRGINMEQQLPEECFPLRAL